MSTTQNGRPARLEAVGSCPYTGFSCGCMKGSLMNLGCTGRAESEEFKRTMARIGKRRKRRR